jgi:hypothetical protein
MKISVLSPTRGRKEILCRGIDTVINTSADLSNLEIIFRFDEDDIQTLNDVMKYYDVEIQTSVNISKTFKWGDSNFKVIHSISKKYKDLTMKFVVGTRHGYIFLNRYYDEMCEISSGEYLMIWTDDFILKPNDKYPGWDSLIREGEGQFYIFSFSWDDGYPRVVPRKYYELNGRLCPNFLDDRFWLEVVKILDIRVDIDWVSDHYCQFDGHGEVDQTAIEGRGTWIREKRSKMGDSWQFYSIEDFERMKEYLKENPNTKLTSQDHSNRFYGKGLTSNSNCWSQQDMQKKDSLL